MDLALEFGNYQNFRQRQRCSPAEDTNHDGSQVCAKEDTKASSVHTDIRPRQMKCFATIGAVDGRHSQLVRSGFESGTITTMPSSSLVNVTQVAKRDLPAAAPSNVIQRSGECRQMQCASQGQAHEKMLVRTSVSDHQGPPC